MYFYDPIILANIISKDIVKCLDCVRYCVILGGILAHLVYLVMYHIDKLSKD